MFKRFLSLLGIAFGLTSTLAQPGIASNPHYATFPSGRYQFYGRTNGASRKRRSNRLRISKMTRNKHR